MGIHKNWREKGVAVIDNVYSEKEITSIEAKIEALIGEKEDAQQIHAVRRVVQQFPHLWKEISTPGLKDLISEIGGDDYFLTKSIYFDKPKGSNWFVAYHQDLTISVKDKIEVNGFHHWTKKQGQIGVIPPVDLLENIFTIRIHLDDTDEKNGALRVIPYSHQKGIQRFENIDTQTEITCRVQRGGVMVMTPLIFHASSRTVSEKRRRVLHLEFSNQSLPTPLNWLETQEFKN